MIKKIHYIWLGGNKKSKRIEKCIASWKKFLPEWEIIEWNESNLNIDELPYCRQAYDNHKYAFVSDYFRFQILYKYGGLYFDTDVEVIHSIDDVLEKYNVIMGFESEQFINPGLVCYASEAKLLFYKTVIETYKNDCFIKSDGSFNTFTICERVTPILEEIGFQIDDTLQVIDGIALFPHEYFCPTDFVWSRQDFTENTRAIHHYDASWKKHNVRMKQNVKKMIYRIFKPQLVKNVLASIRKIRGR